MKAKNGTVHLFDLFDSLQTLLTESSEYILSEKKQEFEREAVTNFSAYLTQLMEDIQAACNGSWHLIEPNWRHLRSKAEALEKGARRRALEQPASEDDFRKNLWWMAERGTKEDLSLLQELKKTPPYFSDEIRELLDTVIRRIRERPAAVLREGDEAYRAHKDEWDQKYAGQHIAVYQGEVIDADRDKARLVERLIKKQKEKGRFRACLIQIGAPLLEVKGPE